MVKMLKDSISEFNEILKKGGKLDFAEVKSKIRECNDRAGSLGLDEIIKGETFINVSISEERKRNPIIWPIELDTKIGKQKFGGFLDTGSPISIIDASIPHHQDLKKSSFINISGITGVAKTLPEIELKYRTQKKRNKGNFAVMHDLSDKIEGHKVLLGRDVFYDTVGGKFR
ncbi:MAG: hypothetical protein GF364_13115 [Candidatus Lokiarchaeota archaeon]|nr:hypothetical protein [Candidatus Lokiarchaeota archaeon]